MTVSDSHWHAQLSRLALSAAERNIAYWLGPFQNYQTFCPYLVGDSQTVAAELASYMQAGFGTFIFDIHRTKRTSTAPCVRSPSRPSRFCEGTVQKAVRLQAPLTEPAADQTEDRAWSCVQLLNVKLDCVTETKLVDELATRSKAGQGGLVVTPNLDVLRTMSRSREVSELVDAAAFRVADGMPLIWASRLQKTPLPERVAGSNLIYSLSQKITSEARTVFLLGGNPGVAERAAEELVGRFPTLQIVGTYFPPFGFRDDAGEMSRMLAAVEQAKPDFVFIGLPFVLAADVGREIHIRFPNVWCLGLGVSLSFVAGDIRRAPRWAQRSGLEWLHRLIQEPSRLARRYLIDGGPFAVRLFASAARVRFIGRLAVMRSRRAAR